MNNYKIEFGKVDDKWFIKIIGHEAETTKWFKKKETAMGELSKAIKDMEKIKIE